MPFYYSLSFQISSIVHNPQMCFYKSDFGMWKDLKTLNQDTLFPHYYSKYIYKFPYKLIAKDKAYRKHVQLPIPMIILCLKTGK